MAVSFGVHGELDVLMDTIRVFKEVSQFARSMWPDDEHVILQRGFWVAISRAILSKYSMK